MRLCQIVPQPVPTRNGDLVTVVSVGSVPEPRIGVLLRWVTGRFVNDGLTPSHLERVGAFMAYLHLSGAQFRPPEGFVRGRLDSLYGKPPGISEALARQQADNPDDEATAIRLVAEVCSPEDGAPVEMLIKRIREVQRAVGLGPETFGLIHDDLHQENYLFHRGQVRAIDFDDCGYGHYLYDIAVTLFNINWRDDSEILREGLLAGYRSVRPLSPSTNSAWTRLWICAIYRLMIWAIEMRDHPAFRDRWESEVKEVLEYLEEIVHK